MLLVRESVTRTSFNKTNHFVFWLQFIKTNFHIYFMVYHKWYDNCKYVQYLNSNKFASKRIKKVGQMPRQKMKDVYCYKKKVLFLIYKPSFQLPQEWSTNSKKMYDKTYSHNYECIIIFIVQQLLFIYSHLLTHSGTKKSKWYIEEMVH